VTAVALLAVLAALAAVAYGDFGTPVNLSADGQDAVNPEVASDADGDSIVVWTRFNGEWIVVQARRVSAGGARGVTQTLSTRGHDASNAHVAIDDDGDAIAVWERGDELGVQRIEAMQISATGVMGNVRTLSAQLRDASLPEVATDAAGDSIAVWLRSDQEGIQRVEARTISSTGALGPVRILSPRGRDAFDPQVATDADGDSIAVWTRSGGLDIVRPQARTISAAGDLGPVLTLRGQEPEASHAQVATDFDGDSIVAWENDFEIEARTISAASSRGPVRILNTSTAPAGDPVVGTAADGDSLVGWQASNQVLARTVSSGSSLGTVNVLGTAFSGPPSIATNPNGDSTVVWEFRPPVSESDDVVQARVVSAAGVVGPLQTLSQPANRFFSLRPRVATDDVGGAIAVWKRLNSSSHEIVQASQGP
jgi:hypothetical protein